MGVMSWPLVLLGLGRASGMQLAANEPRQLVVAANATSARSKRAECTSTQVADGCCDPFGGTATPWQFETFSAHGTWSSNPSQIRFDFADDTYCGGPATQTQFAEASMTVQGPMDVTISMAGVGEAQYEKFELFVNGALETTVQATNGHGGSACMVNTCIMCDVSMPQQTFSLPAGQNTIKVTVNSLDGLWHLGAYFAIAFSTDSGCGSCTCAIPGAGGAASATGDPHLQNVHGERFDLMKPGKHVLINIPRGTNAEHALLRVQADARQVGEQCADMYFQELNITGEWVEAKGTDSIRFQAQDMHDEKPKWMKFGHVQVKVAHGRTQIGAQYLNFYVKHLGHSGHAVGGLLGEDDHADAAMPSKACVHRMALLQVSPWSNPSASVSVAEASFA